MAWWCNAALSNAALVSLLATGAWWLGRRRVRPAVVHAAWVLVLAKLLTPPLIALPLPLEWPTLDAPTSIRWGSALLAAWGLGSLAMTFRIVSRGLRFRTWLRAAGRSDREAQWLAGRLSARIGLSRSPRVLLVDARTTPLVWGLGQFATVIIPDSLWRRANAAHREAMLLHELTHIQRGDPWVRLLEAAAAAVCWWHPALWVARREIALVEETCCDARAVSAYAHPRRQYAEAILAALDFAAGPPRLSLATGIRGGRELSSRFREIMRPSAHPPLTWRLRGVLLLCGLVCLPLYPAPDSTPSTADRGRPVLAARSLR
ncbi:MAG: M56 family metallopeptidase [Planctomyces sp.]|nr:M56 family metallopeptidase [Planctomyces sp.]